MSYNNSRRRRGGRSRGGRSVWPVLGFALTCVAIIVIIFNVTRSASQEASAHEKNAGRADGTVRYPDLETAKGAPSGSVTKTYEGFTICFNPHNRTADWVGWELLGSEVSDEVSRSDNFWQDYDLKGCPSPADYRRSGYDKGHLCPAADQKWSTEAMSDCFVMSNMTPQEHTLNAGAWQTLEKKERLWAQRDSAIVIVAGPIYKDSDTKRIGESGVRVPSAFYKVLLAPYLDSPRAIGFIYPNMKCPGNMADYSMSVDKVEEITGLDFFASLPDEIENNVEKSASFTDWNR